MVTHACKTCLKIFKQRGHLAAHEARQKPCQPDTTIEALVEKKVNEILVKRELTSAKTQINYAVQSRPELITLCKARGIKGYSGKNRADLVKLLTPAAAAAAAVQTNSIIQPPLVVQKICRLNYIGSKFQLLEWISGIMKEKTGWQQFSGKTVADLFAGTGVVSHHFRKHGATVVSNDAELYSSIISHAFTCSTYSESCSVLIAKLQQEVDEKRHLTTVGFVTRHYSPYETNGRKFFTVENAQRIDYMRAGLEAARKGLTEDEYKFVLASLLISADAVSNVPAVYGCFLRDFKAKALKNLTLVPIHTIQTASTGSGTYNSDVLNTEFLNGFTSDLVYLDPPYNERQYSKNYFPLNIIAKTPTQLLSEQPLKGKTGIPTDCFISPFCKKGPVVLAAFDTLFSTLKTSWIFLSYNSESLVSKDAMVELMKKYGTVSVVERDYKRFKSYEYNADVAIKEYLFCLHKTVTAATT